MKAASTQARLDALFEELIMLDEIAGELDPNTNARVDERRREIRNEIQRLRNDLSDSK